jgi:hypothetical protein
MSSEAKLRQVYRIDAIVPAPPGWRAVFAVRTSDGGREWIELEAAPIVGLATVTVCYARSWQPTEEELAEVEVQVHGLVIWGEASELKVAPEAERGEFVGYAEPGQSVERLLDCLGDTKGLPVVIATPEQLRDREQQWAADRRQRHNVIDPPWASQPAAIEVER